MFLLFYQRYRHPALKAFAWVWVSAILAMLTEALDSYSVVTGGARATVSHVAYLVNTPIAEGLMCYFLPMTAYLAVSKAPPQSMYYAVVAFSILYPATFPFEALMDSARFAGIREIGLAFPQLLHVVLVISHYRNIRSREIRSILKSYAVVVVIFILLTLASVAGDQILTIELWPTPAPLFHISKREVEVTGCLLRGLSIYQKTGARSRIQLTNLIVGSDWNRK